MRAGFIISKKSDLTPKTSRLFVGKIVDSEGHAMQNPEATLAAALRGWLRAAVRIYTDSKLLRSLLGRLQWAARPVGAAGPFLPGAYRAHNNGGGQNPPVLVTEPGDLFNDHASVHRA